MEIKVRISRESKLKCKIRDFNDILIVFSWKSSKHGCIPGESGHQTPTVLNKMTCTHSRMRTHARTHARMHTHTRAHACTHTHMPSHTRALAHTQSRAHTRMHIHHDTHGCYVTSTLSGNKWVQGLVPIGRRAAPFQIAFKAERSYNVFGDVAIDDIALTNCSLPPTQDRCSRNQFRCTRGSCVDLGRQCDFTDDCGDNTDELNCGQFNSR